MRLATIPCLRSTLRLFRDSASRSAAARALRAAFALGSVVARDSRRSCRAVRLDDTPGFVIARELRSSFAFGFVVARQLRRSYRALCLDDASSVAVARELRASFEFGSVVAREPRHRKGPTAIGSTGGRAVAFSSGP